MALPFPCLHSTKITPKLQCEYCTQNKWGSKNTNQEHQAAAEYRQIHNVTAILFWKQEWKSTFENPEIPTSIWKTTQHVSYSNSSTTNSWIEYLQVLKILKNIQYYKCGKKNKTLENQVLVQHIKHTVLHRIKT